MCGIRVAAFGKTFGDFAWCCRCEHVNRRSDWEHQAWVCPTPGCGAGGLLAWPWEDLAQFGQDLEAEPVAGGVYPLFRPAKPLTPATGATELRPDPQCRIRETLYREARESNA